MTDWHRLYLIRHGQATAGWGEDPNPGLSLLGFKQAEEAAKKLVEIGPLPLVTSPMRRTQQTAEAFTTVWGSAARIDRRVSEIPSPSLKTNQRSEWLQGVMSGNWSDLPAQKAGNHNLKAWRRGVIDTLTELPGPTVITTHFVAINVVVGHLMDDDRVVCFMPDNCSITIVESNGSRLRLVEQGAEAETIIN